MHGRREIRFESAIFFRAAYRSMRLGIELPLKFVVPDATKVHLNIYGILYIILWMLFFEVINQIIVLLLRLSISPI